MSLAIRHKEIVVSVKLRSRIRNIPAVDVVNRTRLQEKQSRKDAHLHTGRSSGGVTDTWQ